MRIYSPNAASKCKPEIIVLPPISVEEQQYIMNLCSFVVNKFSSARSLVVRRNGSFTIAFRLFDQILAASSSKGEMRRTTCKVLSKDAVT